jgi:ATP-dependent helicase HrpB
MRRIEPDGEWPDCSIEGLQRDLASWLQPWLPAAAGLRALRRQTTETMLQAWLGQALMRRLDRQLPVAVETPAGTRRRIRYAVDADPVLAVPMQELFGEAVGPRLADGRVPLVLHLLSPAGRPLQITRDLAGFWQGAYSDVKKEMRGRYPKHRWPDDPASAEAGRSIKRPRSR